jgi:hypothetical protein
VVFEELEPELSGSNAGKEEVLDLERSEIAVVVEGLDDADVSLGKGSEEMSGLLLSERRGGVFRNGAENDGMSRNRSPSWYESRCPLNSPLNSEGARFTLRSLKRRP